MNVLVIAPHPDDESIGCGGAILLHTSRGERVDVAFLTSGELGLKHLPVADAWAVREAEARAAADILGIRALHFLHQPDWYLGENIDAAADALAPVLSDVAPAVVYLPHPVEWHPDHRAAVPIFEAALARYGSSTITIFLYEVWTPIAEYDHVVDITSVMESKVEAVRAYPSQLNGFRYDDAVYGLNQYRGALAGRCRYAEVFQCHYP
jgi:LmbE family N-acetylglucosaminyl deacetylase